MPPKTQAKKPAHHKVVSEPEDDQDSDHHNTDPEDTSAVDLPPLEETAAVWQRQEQINNRTTATLVQLQNSTQNLQENHQEQQANIQDLTSKMDKLTQIMTTVVEEIKEIKNTTAKI